MADSLTDRYCSLKIGMTVAFFHVCGNLHVGKERLSRYDKEAAILSTLTEEKIG